MEEEENNKIAYFKDKENGDWKEFGKVASIDMVAEVDDNNIFKGIPQLSELELEFALTSDWKKFFNKFKHITKKRFKKLLMSIGYDRNSAEEMAKMEHSFRGYYMNFDIEKCKEITEKCKKILEDILKEKNSCKEEKKNEKI